jgi:eukaryotic-like serine/threonine-protein kinase
VESAIYLFGNNIPHVSESYKSLISLTRNYSSPEFLKKSIVNDKIDVYSMGVVIFYLITGERPWKMKDNEI